MGEYFPGRIVAIEDHPYRTRLTKETPLEKKWAWNHNHAFYLVMGGAITNVAYGVFAYEAIGPISLAVIITLFVIGIALGIKRVPVAKKLPALSVAGSSVDSNLFEIAIEKSEYSNGVTSYTAKCKDKNGNWIRHFGSTEEEAIKRLKSKFALGAVQCDSRSMPTVHTNYTVKVPL